MLQYTSTSMRHLKSASLFSFAQELLPCIGFMYRVPQRINSVNQGLKTQQFALPAMVLSESTAYIAALTRVLCCTRTRHT